MSKKSQSNLSSLWGVVVLVAFVALFAWYRYQETNNGVIDVVEPGDDAATVTDSDMALALLDEEDVSEAMDKPMRGVLVEFNGHMETTEGYEYVSYVGKAYNDTATHKEYVSNAITKYADPSSAQSGIGIKAGQDPRLAMDKTIGEASLAYYSPAGGDLLDSVNVRFSVGNFSAKVQVWDVDNQVTSVDNAKVLLDKAMVLANKQAEDLGDLAAGKFVYDNVSKSEAMKHLPTALNGATYIGSAAVEKVQWMELTGETEADLAGFVSGGLSRFQLIDRSEEVVEVVVMQFETNEQALKYKDTLITGGAFKDENGKVIKLPENLSKDALAMMTDYVVELQFVRGVYLVDVSIFSPFGEVNKVAAQADIVKFGQQVVDWFKE